MRKAFKLQDLDCANCAAKMENAIKNIEGVKSASISFMAQKLVLEADDDRFEAVLDEAQRACKKFEPDCVILR
ncbi:heavy-metal-associated domain-containing protein [Eggerthella lenta]|uniref:cation transporter n=1 Tax=Eggerthella lenta TaxID=84112 RepID=UPI000DF764AB|nr:cation transporter [Eggerthella lenta]MVM48555.1 heavy-metal-associated domain-containing protein [Eggerthella lenta]MVN29256.1 heavy-metal-associated domain-containing protein [Eggerthella lenta]MVN34853.1 heavy-metal-associated domain-containing protein [Eggerthella lenta]RDC07691.1 heavy metal transporter [Eggerthella lenta]